MIMTQSEMERLEKDGRRLLEAYDRGQLPSLLAEVDELARRGPLPADVLGLAAAALVALDRHDEAAKAARGALAQQPRWAWLHRLLAEAKSGLGHPQQAVEAARAAMQILPDQPFYLAHLAACQREAGQPDLAVRTARQALAIDPAHGPSLNQLGIALALAGDREGALTQFRQAQATLPDDPEGYLNEGMLQEKAGRLGEARRAFRAALQRSESPLEAEDRLAGTLSSSPPVRGVIFHLLNLGRLTLVGWSIVAFLYYLLFRLFEFLWKTWPTTLPMGQFLLVVTLIWILGGATLGYLLRFAFRAGWPR